jgi:hypothetical protein
VKPICRCSGEIMTTCSMRTSCDIAGCHAIVAVVSAHNDVTARTVFPESRRVDVELHAVCLRIIEPSWLVKLKQSVQKGILPVSWRIGSPRRVGGIG